MNIRVKLALVFSVTIALSVGAACLAFVQLQKNALRRSEHEKERLLLDSIRKVAAESLLARDPLLVISYLSFLRRERPEVVGCRVLLDGEWQEVAGAGRRDEETARHIIEASLPGTTPRQAAVEIHISSRLLAQRERAQFAAMLRNIARLAAAALCLGIVFSALLSHTMTRRIVNIESALDAIGRGNLAQVVEAAGSDEITRLARGVNEMSQRLSELDEMKKLLVASVSHELRSPLGAIESQLRDVLCAPGNLSPQVQVCLQSIRKHASRLEHFVSSMLELAKIERGKLDFQPRLAQIGPILEDTVQFFSSRAKDSSLQLNVHLEPLPSFEFDPDLIAQVLANLVSNAIKFTEAGGRVTVSARRSGGEVVCCVEDTGIGIPADALRRIFAPFERVANPLRTTGTGLGLAISKAIVERHRGRITVKSQTGKGSLFYFELPLAPLES